MHLIHVRFSVKYAHHGSMLSFDDCTMSYNTHNFTLIYRSGYVDASDAMELTLQLKHDTV